MKQMLWLALARPAPAVETVVSGEEVASHGTLAAASGATAVAASGATAVAAVVASGATAMAPMKNPYMKKTAQQVLMAKAKAQAAAARSNPFANKNMMEMTAAEFIAMIHRCKINLLDPNCFGKIKGDRLLGRNKSKASICLFLFLFLTFSIAFHVFPRL